MGTMVIPMEELVEVLCLQMEHDGKAALTVTGNSMYPMLKNCRDKVYLIQAKAIPKNRALILYHREDGKYILHRIVRIVAPGVYLCAGDNQWETERVDVSQVIAIVESFCRKGKHYSVTDSGYRLYVWVWTMLLPVRRPLLVLRRWLGRIRARMKRKV